jgi:hypothetical protein
MKGRLAMKSIIRRKQIKNHSKKLLAAVAGAAVMSSAMLPGLPVTKVFAASNETNQTPEADQTSKSKNWSNSSKMDPVRTVKENAYTYGFNPFRDKFTILDQSANKATVEVRTSGQTFKVNLVKTRNQGWEITAIRGIGNSRYPATYTPASFFTHRPITGPVVITPNAPQTLYQTNDFREWTWYNTSYPADMTFGALIQDPRLRGTDLVPEDIINQMKNVDFSHQIVVYTHLGTVDSTGYGIGIEKITQSGNDLTVIVRTKSPRLSESVTTTKGYDYIAMERSLFDTRRPIRVTFINQNNTMLTNYNVTLTQ